MNQNEKIAVIGLAVVAAGSVKAAIDERRRNKKLQAVLRDAVGLANYYGNILDDIKYPVTLFDQIVMDHYTK